MDDSTFADLVKSVREGGKMLCKRCGGSGWIMGEVPVLEDGDVVYVETQTHICPDCNGDGCFEEDDPFDTPYDYGYDGDGW